MLGIAFFLSLLACTDDGGPRFPGGSSGPTEAEDTGTPGLQDVTGPEDFEANEALSSCMSRGEVGTEQGEAPPTVEGSYSVSGEAVASDGWPVGTSVTSTMCLWDQSEGGSIEMTEDSDHFDSTADQGWITGEDDTFTIWLELLAEIAHGGCVLQSLGVMTGTVDEGGDLTLRSAAVAVGLEGCDAHYETFLGDCWATAFTATLTGECEG